MAESWLTSKNFWIASAERAVKTFAQGVVAPVSLALAKGSGLMDLSWSDVAITAGVMALLSVGTSIISVTRAKDDSPSLTESS